MKMFGWLSRCGRSLAEVPLPQATHRAQGVAAWRTAQSSKVAYTGRFPSGFLPPDKPKSHILLPNYSFLVCREASRSYTIPITARQDREEQADDEATRKIGNHTARHSWEGLPVLWWKDLSTNFPSWCNEHWRHYCFVHTLSTIKKFRRRSGKDFVDLTIVGTRMRLLKMVPVREITG